MMTPYNSTIFRIVIVGIAIMIGAGTGTWLAQIQERETIINVATVDLCEDHGGCTADEQATLKDDLEKENPSIHIDDEPNATSGYSTSVELEYTGQTQLSDYYPLPHITLYLYNGQWIKTCGCTCQ